MAPANWNHRVNGHVGTRTSWHKDKLALKMVQYGTKRIPLHWVDGIGCACYTLHQSSGNTVQCVGGKSQFCVKFIYLSIFLFAFVFLYGCKFHCYHLVFVNINNIFVFILFNKSCRLTIFFPQSIY